MSPELVIVLMVAVALASLVCLAWGRQHRHPGGTQIAPDRNRFDRFGPRQDGVPGVEEATAGRVTRRTVLAAVTLGSLSACVGTGEPAAPASDGVTPTVRLLPSAEFAEVIREPGRITINVHVPFEGELPRTDLMIPYDQVREQQSRLPADRSAPIAVYCRSGQMSAEAARTLTDLGYADIVDLDGGMEAWRASGGRLLRAQIP